MLSIEFGSGKRGDCDFTSDKDLLLLGSNWKQISDEVARRSLEGFSVSAFLFDKATYLVNNGNLFFKHICDEGILVSGSQDQFQNLILNWRAANDYRDEIYENIDLLELIHFIPQSNFGVAAIVDILISSVRNILIRRLAGQGEYVFSWGKIFAAAHERKLIKYEDIQVFFTARYLKNRYRQNSVPHVPLSYLDCLLRASARACGATLKPRFVHRSELRSLPEKFADGTYKQLRALELMCAEYTFHGALAPLMSLVRQPAYFCANGPNTRFNRVLGKRDASFQT